MALQWFRKDGGTAREAEPLVSVVVPNHDYGRYLRGCLDSLLAQDVDPRRLELIFADDESIDGSMEIALERVQASQLGAWTVLGLERVGRPGPVRNAGLALARGRFLLTLDPDDELIAGFLPRCLELLLAGADVAYTDYLVEEGGKRRAQKLPDFERLILANQNQISPTALFRREFWDAGARFRRGTTYEDWDFWVQLALKGARFAHAAEALYLYRVHGANFSRQARAEDSRAKARLVLANPGFYPTWTRDWARRVEGGDLTADTLGRGLIPILPEQAAHRHLR